VPRPMPPPDARAPGDNANEKGFGNDGGMFIRRR
jgi:hypothetical protein